MDDREFREIMLRAFTMMLRALDKRYGRADGKMQEAAPAEEPPRKPRYLRS